MYCSVSAVIFSRCLIVWSTQCEKAAELSLFCDLMPSFQVIFHAICLFNRNEDVKRRKITDCKSLEISEENVYGEVSFNKVTNLQCFDCNFAIKITHYRYFFENVPNTSCLKKPYFEKKVYGGSAS